MARDKALPGSRKLLRSSALTDAEVVRLYNSLSFAQWQFGPSGIMNIHVTVAWRTLGVENHQRAVHLLTLLLNEGQKWARKGRPGAPPRRRRARTGAGFVLRYVWACEHSPDPRFYLPCLVCRAARGRPRVSRLDRDRLAPIGSAYR
jgi:hypothetical protein